MVISRVTHGSHMRKSGMWSMTLSSHLSLPWSTRVASAATVNALPVEPVEKMVSGPTGRFVPTLRTPQPRASVGLPFSTIAIDTPGIPNCWRNCSTRCSNPVGGAAVAADVSSMAAAAKPASFNIGLLLSFDGRFRAAVGARELPDADGDERQDVGREQDVG